MADQSRLITLVDQLRAEPVETEWLEFKEAKHDFGFDDLGKYFSALANEANLAGRECGWLLFGIANKSPHKVVGTAYRNTPAALQSLKQEISRNLAPGMSFEDIHVIQHPEGGRVLLFRIPAAPRGVPVAWNGHYHGRHGESLGALTLTELDRIRAQASQADWSAELVPDATLDLIEPRAIEVGRAKFAAKHPELASEIESWDSGKFLEKLRLATDGKLTRAALVLFGRREAVMPLTPATAQITWALKDETGNDLDYKHYGPPFLLSSEEMFGNVRNLTYRYMPPGTLFPTEVPQYDNWVIREALHNCIAHQDYSLGGRISVTEKPGELIFTNLGDFLPRDVDEVIRRDAPPEVYRNRRLADAMVDLQMIDTRGGGIRRMFREQRERFFPLPEYALDADARRVEVRIYGKLLDKNYTDALITRQDLTLEEVILLDHLQKHRPITLAEAKRLRTKKLIEGRAPNFYISGTVAKITEQEPAYIRNRGFDDTYYMDLIIHYLAKFGEASRQKLDELLLDKLPESLGRHQRKRRISYLLTKLRTAGRIHNAGSDAQPNWVLSNPATDAKS